MSSSLAEEPDKTPSKQKEEQAPKKKKKKRPKLKLMILPKTTTVKDIAIPILTKKNEEFNVRYFLEYQGQYSGQIPDRKTEGIKNYVEITAESLVAFTPETLAALDEENLKLHLSYDVSFSAKYTRGDYRIESYRMLDDLTYHVVMRHYKSCLQIHKIYHNNLKIKSKYLAFPYKIWTGVRVGVGYEFDENGEFLREVDYNDGYKFTYLDVIKYCEENQMQVNTLERAPGTAVWKVTEQGKKAWCIRYRYSGRKMGTTPGIFIIDKFLDGETGEVLRTKKEKEKHF